jgi:hypothetical protein
MAMAGLRGGVCADPESVSGSFGSNLRAVWVNLAVRFILLIVITIELIVSLKRGYTFAAITGACFVVVMAGSLVAIVGGSWYEAAHDDAPLSDGPPLGEGDQSSTRSSSECPPNYHWDNSVGGCVPDK